MKRVSAALTALKAAGWISIEYDRHLDENGLILAQDLLIDLKRRSPSRSVKKRPTGAPNLHRGSVKKRPTGSCEEGQKTPQSVLSEQRGDDARSLAVAVVSPQQQQHTEENVQDATAESREPTSGSLREPLVGEGWRLAVLERDLRSKHGLLTSMDLMAKLGRGERTLEELEAIAKDPSLLGGPPAPQQPAPPAVEAVEEKKPDPNAGLEEVAKALFGG